MRLRLLSCTLSLAFLSPFFASAEEAKPAEGASLTPAEVAPAEAAPNNAAATNPPEKPAEEAPKQEVIEVRVLGQSDDALQKTPGSGALVSAKEIRRVQPADAGEILRRVPGLYVRPEEGLGLRLNLGMRGLDPTRSRKVLILEDGIPVAINPYGEPDLYYSTPVERIRAVEVVKGSGSILFGPQTVGGVVNFLTLAPPDKPEWSLEGVYGQRNYLKLVGNYGGSVADGAARYVAQITRKQGDGFRGMEFAATDFLGKVAFQTGERSEATVKLAIYDEFSRSTYVGLTRPMFELDPRTPTIAPHDAFYVRRYDASLTHEYRISAQTALRTFVYGYITHRAWRRQNYDREEVPGVTYERVVGEKNIPGAAIYFRDTSIIRDRSYEVLGAEPRLEHRFATGSVRHTLTAGARLHVETAERLQYLTEFVTSNAGDLQSEEFHRTYAAAAYVQDRLAFRDNLMVTPGVRMEYVDSLRQQRRIDTDGPPHDVWIRGTSEDLAFMPAINLIYGTPRLSFFGGMHVGYSPPRVSAAIAANGQDIGLDAEKSTNYEVGVRLGKPKWLRAEVVGFLMDFKNQVITGNIESGQDSELVNGGRTLHRGVESSVSLGLGQALKLPLTLDLTGRYTFSYATFTGGPFRGNRLPYAPEHTASVSLDVEHKIGLGADITWTYVSDQFTDAANTVPVDITGRVGLLPAYQVVDLGLRYLHPKTKIGAQISVKNALDQVFATTRLPDGIQTGGYRQVNLGVRWDHK